jgi:hypothetical protein
MILEELIQGVVAASRIDWQKFETFYAYFQSVTCQTSVWCNLNESKTSIVVLLGEKKKYLGCFNLLILLLDVKGAWLQHANKEQIWFAKECLVVFPVMRAKIKKEIEEHANYIENYQCNNTSLV